MSKVHPSAIVDAGAHVHPSVEVGPWSWIGAGVVVAEDTVIGSSVRISGPTRIGRGNRFIGNASIGTDPQDLKFGGEKTELEIGDGNVFREFVTINRGTRGGGGITRIGSDNFFMAYAHVAHDCIVGSNTIFANGATLAGHVEVGDFATVGAYSMIHQFCRVGDHAFIGGGSIATQDVLPFVKTVGSRPAKTYGINTIGLQRKGYEKETIEGLQRAYRILVRSKLPLEKALERIDQELSLYPECRYFADFVRSSERGLVR